MKTSATLISALMLFSGCTFHPQPSAATSARNDVQPSLPTSPLYHLTVDLYDNSVDVCAHSDDEQHEGLGETMDCLPSSNRIQWKGDLNGDGIQDYILINQTGRWGEDEIDMFFVFVGASGNLHYKYGELFTTSLSPTAEPSDGFKVLNSQANCIDPERGDSFSVTSPVKFDPHSMQYRTDLLHDDERYTLCSLGPPSPKEGLNYAP